MKKILMIATGGTIASKGTADGLAPELTSQDILHYIPSLKDICEVETLQLCNLDSTNISMEHWMMMANAIEEKYEKYDGFVICHGTDTMAYTASALSYLVQHSPKPIVLTGSQKPVDMEIRMQGPIFWIVLSMHPQMMPAVFRLSFPEKLFWEQEPEKSGQRVFRLLQVLIIQVLQ